MEARILPLPTPMAPAPSMRDARVRLEGDRIVIERLVLQDAALAGSLAERDD
jgi:hypothetical protein